jgi:anti-anti-sigma factor
VQIDESNLGSVCILHPHGRIDGSKAPAFQEKMLHAVANAVGGVVIDFADVNYISSAGLRALMSAVRQRKDRRLAVAALTPILQEIFVIARFQHVVKVFLTVEEAANSWGAAPAQPAGVAKEAHAKD